MRFTQVENLLYRVAFAEIDRRRAQFRRLLQAIIDAIHDVDFGSAANLGAEAGH
ncbi:MAG: hypothetical protein WBV40_01740 [Candidatus Cybelea sp.]